MRSAAALEFSCSHTRITVHPSSANVWLTAASRAAFRPIFTDQYSAFVLGMMKCSGQPCQKQPSTNTAIFALVNTKSARDLTPLIGELSTRNRSPRECRIERNDSSGFVSRRLFARIVRRACSDDAQDSRRRSPTILYISISSEFALADNPKVS